MISPLGQRQIFQTANVEAVRQAQEVSEQIQRENVRKRVVDEHLLEDEASVRVISSSERIRTDERQGRQEQQGAESQGAEDKAKQEGGEKPAESAETRLDFLA
mgnify:CR=1 FL=1